MVRVRDRFSVVVFDGMLTHDHADNSSAFLDLFQFGKRAFSVCGTEVWNSVPTAVRNIDSYPAFRRALKPRSFSRAFSS